MSGNFVTYPPNYVKPGDTVHLSAENGEIEFIGVYDDRVVDFVTAFYDWQQMKESSIESSAPVSSATLEYAEKKTLRAFNSLPNHLKKLMMERSGGSGAIWVPDPRSDNAG